MQESRLKKQGNKFGEFVALLTGFVFGLIGVDNIVKEGMIKPFGLIPFLENNFGYLLMLFAGIILVILYIALHSKDAVRLLKEKEWVNILYPLWIISILSPVLKYNNSFYIRLLPILIPLITLFVLVKFNTKITGRSMKSYLSEIFSYKRTA